MRLEELPYQLCCVDGHAGRALFRHSEWQVTLSTRCSRPGMPTVLDRIAGDGPSVGAGMNLDVLHPSILQRCVGSGISTDAVSSAVNLEDRGATVARARKLTSCGQEGSHWGDGSDPFLTDEVVKQFRTN